MVPKRKVAGALLVIVMFAGNEQLSVAVGGTKVIVFVQVPGSTFTVTLSKGAKTGGIWSNTVNIKLHVLE